MFCKAFYVCYQMACIMLITLVLLLAHSCFGNHVGNFFQSINRSGIQSSCLWSICHENNNWPIFLVFLPSVDPNCFVFSEGWPKSIRSIQYTTNFTEKTVDRTCIIGVEGTYADHLTTTTAPTHGNPWLKQV